MAGRLIITGGVREQVHRIDQTPVAIGRGRDNDLRLLHPAVSLHHARVDPAGGRVALVDLGSANGTQINGHDLDPRQPATLHDGDIVTVATFTLTYQVAEDRAGDSAAPLPPVAHRTAVEAPASAAELVVTTPAGTIRHPLRGTTTSIGRDPANDIVIDRDAVSRHHARLESREGGWRIVDLGSLNGLEIGGRRVQEHQLQDGDRLRIGRSVTLELAAGSSATAAPDADKDQVGVLEVPEGGDVTIGRAAGADLAVRHPQASVRHATVLRRGGRLVVRDLDSAAGTFVNGHRVQEQELGEGDVVRVAARRLSVHDGRLEVVDEEGSLELSAEHLAVRVDHDMCILDDVSLTITPGSFVAVIGGSGSGKSTLVNALSGFRPATSGLVSVNGVDLYRSFDAYRTDLGYVPQDDIIHLDLPVERALTYAARLRLPPDTGPGERAERVREVLSELDLAEVSDRPIRLLSGGQRKRASIAVELLTRPSLFFLDEATSGLDPATESQLMRLLRRLADQGRTVVLITHATRNVMLCDAVLVMARGGRLAFDGPPDAALGYFGVSCIDDVFERLEERPAEEWGRRWREAAAGSPADHGGDCPAGDGRRDHGGEDCPAAAGEPPARLPAAARSARVALNGERPRVVAARPARPRLSWWSELATLSRRYFDIVTRDRKTLALLLLIAPILGALDFIVWDRDLFDPVTGSATKAVTMFFIATLITILVGTVTSVREIVKEDPIYRRERMVGIRVVPYVASKVVVGSVFAAYSGLVLFLFMLLSVDFP